MEWLHLNRAEAERSGEIWNGDPQHHFFSSDVSVLNQFNQFLDHVKVHKSQLFERITASLDVIEQTCQKSRCDEICIAFNGGKDCTVLLHLVHIWRLRHFAKTSSKNNESTERLLSLHVKPKEAFEELEMFIDECVVRYNLDMITIEAPMKAALEQLKSAHPKVQCIFMGTRTTDPNAHNLSHFAKTDSGWPDFMRVSPLMHWTYQDIWSFLLGLSIPYCSLYDNGYTSLGSKSNTIPNDALAYVDSDGVKRYKPAHLLDDASQERTCRV